MPSASAPVWQCISPDAVVWREWDDEFVVRNERSGSSHLLGPLAGRVLQILLESDTAMSVSDIANQLGDERPTSPDSEWLGAIQNVLAEFHRLELAEPLPS
jgi:PqqD family protein of HPr-rel-A system